MQSVVKLIFLLLVYGINIWDLFNKERMAVSTEEAWDVPGVEEGLLADPTRKGEIIWSELVDQRINVEETNADWLQKFKKKYGLD